jgi:PKD repeat protein
MRIQVLGLVVLAALALPSCKDDNNDGDGANPTSATGAPQTGSGGALAVSITASATAGRAPFEVRFTSDVRGGNGVLRYDWDFGDGTRSSDRNPTARYVAGGSFPVTLTVTSDNEQVTSGAVTVRVESDVRLACTAEPVEGIAPVTVAFRSEPAGGVGDYTFVWNFGDGGSSTERNPRHTYASPGTYIQTMTVTSGNSQATCRETIYAYGNFSVGCRASLVAPNTIHLRALPNFCLGSCTYAWNFGDGTGLPQGPNFRPDHVYSSGVYTASVTARTQRQQDTCAVTFTVP